MLPHICFSDVLVLSKLCMFTIQKAEEAKKAAEAAKVTEAEKASASTASAVAGVTATPELVVESPTPDKAPILETKQPATPEEKAAVAAASKVQIDEVHI